MTTLTIIAALIGGFLGGLGLLVWLLWQAGVFRLSQHPHDSPWQL